MKILNIIPGTIVDGPGLRTSVYISGCSHNCIGCHNPSSWDFNAGKDISIKELVSICVREELPVTLTGGDPVFNSKTPELVESLVHAGITDIWMYTGFTMEYLQEQRSLNNLLNNLTGIVDGPFILKLRNTELMYRGSSNQRIWIKSDGIWVDSTKIFKINNENQ